MVDGTALVIVADRLTAKGSLKLRATGQDQRPRPADRLPGRRRLDDDRAAAARRRSTASSARAARRSASTIALSRGLRGSSILISMLGSLGSFGSTTTVPSCSSRIVKRGQPAILATRVASLSMSRLFIAAASSQALTRDRRTVWVQFGARQHQGTAMIDGRLRCQRMQRIDARRARFELDPVALAVYVMSSRCSSGRPLTGNGKGGDNRRRPLSLSVIHFADLAPVRQAGPPLG
jgi:hypothetical protein